MYSYELVIVAYCTSCRPSWTHMRASSRAVRAPRRAAAGGPAWTTLCAGECMSSISWELENVGNKERQSTSACVLTGMGSEAKVLCKTVPGPHTVLFNEICLSAGTRRKAPSRCCANTSQSRSNNRNAVLYDASICTHIHKFYNAMQLIDQWQVIFLKSLTEFASKKYFYNSRQNFRSNQFFEIWINYRMLNSP